MVIPVIAISLVVIALIAVYLCYIHWSVSVPDFMAARHYRFGRPSTDGPISGRRILVIPTIDQVVMIDTRIQKTAIENISILTKERQVMNLSVTLIWKPINAAMTIESIKPEDIEPTFFRIAESVIKNEASKMTVDEILENRSILSKNLLSTLSETTDSWGISVSSVNISNLVVVNENFMRNMALPREIEQERKAKLAQIEKDLALDLRNIEKEKESELSRLESDRAVGLKREETTTVLEQAQKEREALILEMEIKVAQLSSEINLIEKKCETAAESNRITETLLAETQGLKEKLKVINGCSPNAINFELLKILPELYKNIEIGDITLFEGAQEGGHGFDFGSYAAASALTLMRRLGSGLPVLGEAAAEAETTVEMEQAG